MAVRWSAPVSQQGTSSAQRRLVRLLRAAVTLGLVVLVSWVVLGRPRLPWQHEGLVWQRVADGNGGFLRVAVPASQGAVVTGPAPKAGTSPPDFSLRTVDGTFLHLADLKGRPVLINFWATWCQPCRKEFPTLAALAQSQPADGLIVLGIDVGEGRDEVIRFGQESGATFPLVLDSDSSVAHQYRLAGLPTSFFLDRTGVVRAQQVGPLTQAGLEKQLTQAGVSPAPAR